MRSIYLKFLSSNKPISQTLTPCLLTRLHLYHPVFYYGCAQMSWVATVTLLEQKLCEMDGNCSGAIHPRLEASSFLLSHSITPAILSFLLSPLSVLLPLSLCSVSLSSNHTWLLDHRFRGSKDSVSINSYVSDFFSSPGGIFLEQERKIERD